MQQQVHLRQHVGERLRLSAANALLLESLAVLDRLALFFEMGEGLGEKPAGSAGRVEDHFAQLWVGDCDHELNHGPWRVELAGVASGVSHLPEHRLVEPGQRVDFLGGVEVDAVDQVDHVPHQVAGDHPVDDAIEDGGDHVAAAGRRWLSAGCGDRRTSRGHASRQAERPHPG